MVPAHAFTVWAPEADVDMYVPHRGLYRCYSRLENSRNLKRRGFPSCLCQPQRPPVDFLFTHITPSTSLSSYGSYPVIIYKLQPPSLLKTRTTKGNTFFKCPEHDKRTWDNGMFWNRRTEWLNHTCGKAVFHPIPLILSDHVTGLPVQK